MSPEELAAARAEVDRLHAVYAEAQAHCEKLHLAAENASSALGGWRSRAAKRAAATRAAKVAVRAQNAWWTAFQALAASEKSVTQC